MPLKNAFHPNPERHSPRSLPGLSGSKGFVLAFTIILILGVTAISVGTMYNGKMGRMSSLNYKHKIMNFNASDGLMTLLAQELINGNGSKYVDMTRVGSIDGKKWTGLPGNSVATLKSAILSSPTTGKTISSYYLGSDLDSTNYGIKWTGWLLPPLSGSYIFYTRSDDNSEFWLSKDASPANLPSSPTCSEPVWVFRWPSSGTAVSNPISLVGGNRYYFEYYHKQGGGGDIGQMGWDGPEYFSERPITGAYLSKYGTDAGWAGTVLVGSLPVRYQVAGVGMDRYRIATEALDMRAGSSVDTAFRTPLVQSLSLKGTVTAPSATLWLRVIHYDYRSGFHPEFDPPAIGGFALGLTRDMVNFNLTNFIATDAGFFGRTTIPKPTKNLTVANRNCGLNTWFQEVKTWATFYNYPTATDCISSRMDNSGVLYNTKRYDSLQFTLDPTQGPNTYVYSHMGNYDTGDPVTSWRGDPSEYFPLDKYGQDPAGSGHNYSFCTEMHTDFIYQSGLKFEFTGDDDVWVFVNNQGVIDLGGVHPAMSTILNLDDLKTLKFGTKYNFDFFQCERRRNNSSSRIVTNIKTVPPTGNPVASWKRDYGSFD